MALIRSILVPVDASDCSIAALEYASALAQELGASLEILQVLPEQHRLSPAETAEPSQQQLEAAIGRVRAGSASVQQRVAPGEPLRNILEAARDHDLVVMGTHGRIGRLQSLLGSVAEAVVRSAPRPVLTVREPDGTEESFAERVHGRPSLADQVRPNQ